MQHDIISSTQPLPFLSFLFLPFYESTPFPQDFSLINYGLVHFVAIITLNFLVVWTDLCFLNPYSPAFN